MHLERSIKDLNEMEKGLENARTSAEARPLLDRAGYTLEAVAEGQALYDEAQRLIPAQSQAVKTHTDLQAQVRTLEAQRDAQYELDREMARRALSDDKSAQKLLKVDSAPDRTLAGLLNQIRTLYSPDLDPAIAAKLEKKGLTATIRAEGLKLANEAQLTRAQCDAAEATQVETTQKRDTAIEQALEWYKEFRRVARKAFRDRPELLRLFGFEE